MARTLTAIFLGSRNNLSPSETLPEIAVPVTMRPTPLTKKLRSIDSRKYPLSVRSACPIAS